MSTMKNNMVKVVFHENNSGGHWWLCKEQYKALEAAGWKVHRWPSEYARERDGSGWERPYQMHKWFPTLDDGVREFEVVCGVDSEERGCECCGQPYELHISSW